MSIYGSLFSIDTYSGHTREQRYISEISQLIMMSQDAMPEVLWHYTKPEVAPLILKTNKLRFTHAASFEDVEEVNHSLKFARLILDTLLPEAEDSRDKLLMKKIGDQMIATNKDSRWFISCFTDSCVSDFHWKEYSSDFSGCCIGFDAKELIKFFSRSPSEHSLALKTIYDTQEMINFGSAALSFGISNFRQYYGHLEDVDSAMDQFLREWGKHVDPASVMFKKEEYRQEKEWRLGRSVESATSDDQPFLDRTGKMRWDVTKSLQSDCASENLPIRHIVIGKNSVLTASDCRTLLEENGFRGVEVLQQG